MIEREGRTRRRRQRSRAEAEQLAAAFEASGLTRRQFSERNDVCVNTLARYLTRYRQHQTTGNKGEEWVAVEIAETRSVASELVLVLRQDRRIEVKRGFDAGTLRELVRVLEQI